MKHLQTRNGAALLDAVVAASLVMLTIAIATPTVVRSARVWKQTRNFQMACDELAGQMDRLIAMPSDLRSEALEQLSVRPELSTLLPNAKLAGRLIESQEDTRLELSINWQRTGNPPPVTLVAWVNPINGSTQPKTTPKKDPPSDGEGNREQETKTESDDRTDSAPSDTANPSQEVSDET